LGVFYLDGQMQCGLQLEGSITLSLLIESKLF